MLKTPGIEKFNGSYFDMYKAVYSMIAHEVTQLKSAFKEKEGLINDINGYKVSILTKLLYSANSFLLVIENNKDFVTSSAILRLIADNIASYSFIYRGESEEETQLRHFLFIHNGLKERLSCMENLLPKQSNIILDIEKRKIISELEFAITETQAAIKLCMDSIYSLQLYHTHKNEIDIIIRNAKSWRYKTPTNHKDYYTWKDLYSFIVGAESCNEFLSYLSQYIHGLSSSNLLFERDDDTFSPLICYGIFFLGKIKEFVENDFSIDRDFLLNNFQNSNYWEAYLSHINFPLYLELSITNN